MSTRWVVWEDEWGRHSEGPPPTPMFKSTLRYMLRPSAWEVLEGALQEHQEVLGGLEADGPSHSL